MTKRKVEIFSAGCPLCQTVVARIQWMACPCCDVTVLDTHDPRIADRARQLGVGRVPAVAVNGVPVACCADGEVNEQDWRAAGIGQPLA